MELTIKKYFSILLLTTLSQMLLSSCVASSGDEDSASGNSSADPLAIGFRGSVQLFKTRAQINTTEDLQHVGFGVFTQSTGNQDWTTYHATAKPFNFMWNQKVDWNDGLTAWTYSPVKYWPNDNQPADDKGATGSQEHSYLNFFAYAPYVNASELPGTLSDDGVLTGGASHDGIIAMTSNATNAGGDYVYVTSNPYTGGSYIYYRTSIEKPFDPDKSVDLMWATRQDLYKMKSSGEGYVNGHVDFLFKHALTKLSITAKLLVDRTTNYTSPAYSEQLDENTKVFIEEARVITPDIYSEGRLMIAPDQTTPKWDYTGLAAEPDFFHYDAITSNTTEDVKYSMRYAAPNIPSSTITDSNSDGLDDDTGLTEQETAKANFDAMENGVLTTEQQLPANYSTYMFLPSEDTEALTIRVKYHVVTYDENLVLNEPKYYSDIANDITATVGDGSFKFEPNKQYKIVMILGLTSAKFEVYELDEQDEWILLSATVKNWDVKTIEANVK